MRESYRERRSKPLWPRAMRGRSVRSHLKRWTGVYAGWVWSSEIANPGCRRCQANRKDKIRCAQDCECAVTLRSRRPQACIETPCARTERPRGRPPSRRGAGRWEKAMSYKTHMDGGGESYSGVVPTKQPNKGGRPLAEVVEERPLTKENTDRLNPYRTPRRTLRATRAGSCAGSRGMGFHVRIRGRNRVR